MGGVLDVLFGCVEAAAGVKNCRKRRDMILASIEEISGSGDTGEVSFFSGYI